MIDKAHIESLASAWLEENGGFLVEVKVSADNSISIAADKVTGIQLKELSQLHRHIESHFNREVVDFNLEVSSPGMDRAFVVAAQYQKNLGRSVKVKTKTGEVIKGILSKAEPNHIELTRQERVAKEVGKGKKTIEVITSVDMDNILETKLDFRF